MSGLCPKAAWKVSGRCLEGVWKVSERYLEGVLKLSDKLNLNLERGTSSPACLVIFLQHLSLFLFKAIAPGQHSQPG